ncbi:MAG: integrative and conjugative element protein (TIGR02256 family) [Sediminicola sp.]|jgi:integrative and conjugative element protein (TIGR02256 family)
MLNYKIKNACGIHIDISSKAKSIFLEHRQIKATNKEACGIILGGLVRHTNTIFIDECTAPGHLDQRHRFHYTMLDPQHQNSINKAFKDSNGFTNYLGIWHSHPEPHPIPSAIDMQDWKKAMMINSNILPAFVFVIVGTQSVSLFPYLNSQYSETST